MEPGENSTCRKEKHCGLFRNLLRKREEEWGKGLPGKNGLLGPKKKCWGFRRGERGFRRNVLPKKKHPNKRRDNKTNVVVMKNEILPGRGGGGKVLSGGGKIRQTSHGEKEILRSNLGPVEWKEERGKVVLPGGFLKRKDAISPF